MSTTTDDSKVRSLDAVVAPESANDVATPWVSLMVWLVAVKPLEVKVNV
jgi:hypothetical protein